ncbi:MAG: phosphatidate cytidylyltransferase [Gemmatimonadales bacterium]
MASNMVRRVAFAAVAIPAAFGLVWLGGWPLVALVALAGALGTRELFGFAERQGLRPWRAWGFVLAAAFAPVAWAVARSEEVASLVAGAWPYVTGLLIVLLLLGTLVRLAPGEHPLGSAAVTLLGPLYAGALPAFLIAIRHQGHGTRSWPGTALVFMPLVITWVCDSAAMFVGQRMGGAKLWPSVSPGKTWSGTVGGFLAALLVVPVYHRVALAPAGVDFPVWQGLLIAAGVGSLGQLGDLAESLFKREVGLKDSSNLIPGHGGVLDRFDSLYVVLPVTAALYRLFGVI